MRIRGGSAAQVAMGVLDAARGHGARFASSPALGLVVIAPLMLVAAVGASAPQPPAPQNDPGITPMAAVVAAPDDDAPGPVVIQVERPPTSFHFATASTLSAPPPAVVVSSPGSLQIPNIALKAYRNAERMMAMASPGCGISWNLLAGIGRIESGHANGGATDAHGNPVNAIFGPALDGTLPGNEVIVQSATSNAVTYARAMGPMQFLPGTWSRYASDGDGDGKTNPQNLYDATLAAARYLCSGGLNMRDGSQVMTSVLRYNNSVAYAHNVLGWAAAYATGVVPVDLPAINGPVPPIGDVHLDAYQGLGPGLPMNAGGLPPTDPMAQVPLVAFENTDVASQLPTTPAPQYGPLPGPAAPPCSLICFGQNQAPAPEVPAAPPPAPLPFWMPAPAPEPQPLFGAPPALPLPDATPPPPAGSVLPEQVPQGSGPLPGPVA